MQLGSTTFYEEQTVQCKCVLDLRHSICSETARCLSQMGWRAEILKGCKYCSKTEGDRQRSNGDRSLRDAPVERKY